MITTTLNEIRSFNPCRAGWEKLLNHLGKTASYDEEFPLVTVLDSNGLNDTIWCLRVCPDVAVTFVNWCAERVSIYNDRHPKAANAARHAARQARHARDARDARDARNACDVAIYAMAAASCAEFVACPDSNTERQTLTEKLRELLS